MDETGIPGAITSSSPMEFIEKHLVNTNLLHRFRKLCSGHSIPNGKPAPDIYLLGAAELRLKPEECLALEDSPTGILSAYRAGCLPVIIPDLDQPSEETQKLLFAKADSLTDVISLLK
jgi:beta-phosphoglucomutase-like phosphatase (HAD superfamily)